ncbi:uncharacterized protein LOC134258592 [Saccostrea cucullata]|uniref:uncharacterized protein LOC134258592 n=1 Tax=Saccostrea cuccullata TaxID=36930 RepID=UPI002ED26D18
MYGFRFEGDVYITIACEVGVFPENPDHKICKNSSRRKRDTEITKRDVVETAIHRKNINGKLRILDYPSEYGNSASVTGGSFKWSMLSLGIMISSLLCSIYK